MEDPHKAYSNLLTNAFERLRKALSGKKFSEFHEMLQVSTQQVQSDKTLNSNKYFPIFKLALDYKVPKGLEIALYHLQKLISHGFMSGNCHDLTQEDPTPGRSLIDAIVESVCACVHERDDQIQLQVLKTILTIVTSSYCEVHNTSLVEAFRACYHIHITSKNQVNLVTAKATLTQMVHVVFQRMENYTMKDVGQTPINTIVETVMKSILDRVEFEDETEVPMPCVICRRDGTETSGGYTFYSQECIDKMELMCQEADRFWFNTDEFVGRNYFNDAILIFRQFCKFSLRDLENTNTQVIMRAKVLSLEQIFAVIENPGHNLSSRKEFIDIIKNNLCESLLANSVSSDKIVFELSLSIFVALLNNFKEHLKTEIGLFLEQVFLKILNSENASYHHKILVLEVLNRITQNCVTTIELFINYDCDVDSTDIFARIIESLARIAQGTRQETAQQENSLKIVALQTLTEIVKSQVAWLESERAQTSSIVDTGTTQESELDETMNDFGSEIAPVDKFEKSKQLKTDLSRAIAKFNFKPKLGLNFLNQMGHLDKENALEVAQFLKNTEGLSKTAIGEYIGSENPYQKQVLSEFTNLHDFVDLFFTKAIRQYLSAFRLPGESQIIDRIMEMFAEKYCKDNPNCAFENATAAYVLAYATIMLQTDAHNPQVKNKMTLDGFCSINRGINDGQDLERDFLSQIYTDIIENPITLLEDDKLRAKERKPSDVQKPDMYAQETENILRESTAAFKNAKLSTYHTVSSSDSVRPMLESLWHPLLAVFSIVLEEAEERRFWNMCLEGYMSCVRICAFFNMELQIESFICSLAKFTMMEQFREEITDKNIECAKALLNIAKTDYNSLRSSWIHILKCISRLDYLHIIQSGIRTDAELFGTGISDTEIRCSEIQQINPSEIDYIFNVSSQLDDHSIVEFVKNLVEVAKSELWSANPRIFSLQELISVAGVNMSRIRFIWAQMWKHLQSFFCEVLLHSNNQVAFFSVDALRQLSIKFLQKEELSNYTFQKEFLYPFEMTVKQSTSNEVKGLVVSCMLNIVLSLVHNIKSGWKSIFEIFKMAAKDQNAEIIRESFQAVSKIVENHLSYTYEHFFELIDCLISFSKNYIEEISIGAINSLQVCASEYSTGKVQTEVWFALLSGLANLVLDLREPIQSKALDTLFNILQFTEFDNEQWKTIYSGVLVPLFDDIQYCPQETRKTKQEIKWIKTTCQQALISLCELISVKYKDLEFIVSDFLTLLKKSVENSHEVIAQVSLDILKHLIMVCGGKLNVDLWHQIAGHYEELFTSTAPQHLLTEEIDLEDLENQKHVALNFSVDKSVNQCVIQLRLVTSIKDITEMHYGKIPQEDMMKILNAVEHSYRFAQTFNSQVILRYKLWKNGFMEEMRNLPGLLKQEKESLNVYLTLLFRMLIELEADDQKAIKERLKDIWSSVIYDFLQKQVSIDEKKEPVEEISELQKKVQVLKDEDLKKDVTSMTPIICNCILVNVIQLEGNELVELLGPSLINLVQTSSKEIREQLKAVFSKILIS